MSFQNPSWLLLGLPLAAVLVALYLLRMRRKDLVVPASFLWPSRTDEVRANSLFQKLKPNWLLFLQLMALAGLVGALAQPQCSSSSLAGKVTVLVLDPSASMTAVDEAGGSSRFDQALKVLAQTVASAKPGDRLALILAGPSPSVIFPLSSDQARQRAALRGLAPVEAGTDMGQALRLASAIASGSKGAEILVLSDGVFPPVLDFSPGESKVRFQQLGSPSSNVAIEAFGVNGSTGQALLALRRHGPPLAGSSVNLYADGSLIDSVKVDLQTGDRWTRTFRPPRGARVLTAQVKAADALAADNFGAVPAAAGDALRVLLVGTESLFLERALSLEPRVALDKSPGLPESEIPGSPGPGGYDLVIFNQVSPEPVKARGMLVFGASSPIAAGTPARQPQWLSSGAHPVLKGVDLEGIYVESGWTLQPRGSGQVVSQSTKGAWMAASSADATPLVVHVGFGLEDSDFPLKVSFPIFLYQCLEWLGGKRQGGALFTTPGRAFSLPASGQSAAISGPSGWKAEAKAEKGRTIAPPLPSVGAYTATWPGGKAPILASLRDPLESSLSPAASLSLGQAEVSAEKTRVRLADVWKPILLAALLILAGEWWLFMRRS